MLGRMGSNGQDLQSRPKNPAKRDFHIALALVFIPLLSLPVVWVLAIVRWRKTDKAPHEKPWAYGLVGLGVLDTAVAITIVALQSGLLSSPSFLEPEETSRPMIGVVLEEGSGKPGCMIKKILSESPAEKGGLKPRDRIVSMDKAEVKDCPHLQQLLAAGKEAQPRKFHILRGADHLDLAVTPEVERPEEASIKAMGLFEGQESCKFLGRVQGSLLWLLAALVLLAGTALLGRRRAKGPYAFIVMIILSLATYSLVPYAVMKLFCQIFGSMTLEGFLLGLGLGALAEMMIVLGFYYRFKRQGALEKGLAPTLSVVRAVLISFLYLFAGGMRLAFVLILIDALLKPSSSLSMMEVVQYSLSTPFTTLLFILVAVGIAPLAEELLFRGVILPWMSRWLGWKPALALSAFAFAMLHLDYDFYGMIVIFYFGLILGWARLRTAGLRAPILLHMLFNTLALCSFYIW